MLILFASIKWKKYYRTGSKNLQEQLFHRDLPLIADAVSFKGVIALLKGRANYLCIDRLDREVSESHSPQAEPTLFHQLSQIRRWQSESRSGDLSECTSLPEDSSLIPTITSTNENCLGKSVRILRTALYLKRKKAMDADVVVVNHHLFLADLQSKRQGLGS